MATLSDILDWADKQTGDIEPKAPGIPPKAVAPETPAARPVTKWNHGSYSSEARVPATEVVPPNQASMKDLYRWADLIDAPPRKSVSRWDAPSMPGPYYGRMKTEMMDDVQVDTLQEAIIRNAAGGDPFAEKERQIRHVVTRIPTAPAELEWSLKVGESFKRHKAGEATDEDLSILAEFVNEAWRQDKKHWTQNAIEMMSMLPKYMVEFSVGAGVYHAGKGAVKDLGYDVAKRGAANTVVKEFVREGLKTKAGKAGAWMAKEGVDAAGSVVGAAGQALANPDLAAKAIVQRLGPEVGLSVDDAGQLEFLLKQSDEAFATSVGKGTLDGVIEVLSERLGGKIAKSVLVKQVKGAIVGRFLGKSGNNMAKAQATLLKGGWNGILTESFEERAGEVARGVTQVEKDFGVAGELATNPLSKEAWLQIATEMVAFSPPMVVTGGARFADARKRKSDLKQLKEVLHPQLQQSRENRQMPEAEMVEKFRATIARIEEDGVPSRAEARFLNFPFKQQKTTKQRKAYYAQRRDEYAGLLRPQEEAPAEEEQTPAPTEPTSPAAEATPHEAPTTPAEPPQAETPSPTPQEPQAPAKTTAPAPKPKTPVRRFDIIQRLKSRDRGGRIYLSDLREEHLGHLSREQQDELLREWEKAEAVAFYPLENPREKTEAYTAAGLANSAGSNREFLIVDAHDLGNFESAEEVTPQQPASQRRKFVEFTAEKQGAEKAEAHAQLIDATLGRMVEEGKATDLEHAWDTFGPNVTDRPPSDKDVLKSRALKKKEGDVLFDRDADPTPTKTPAFRKWFGKSKIVDGEGKPLRVYHGTRGESFNTFDDSLAGTTSGDDGWYGRGFYFTADEESADMYAPEVERGRIYPVYLSLQNPLRISTKTDHGTIEAIRGLKAWDKRAEEELDRTAQITKEENPEGYKTVHLLIDMGFTGTDFRQIVEEAGHDGIIIDLSATITMEGAEMHEIVAFDPEQIKSATGNRGSFDASNADITYSRDEEQMPRGAYDPNKNLIHLLHSAHESTLPHEIFHWAQDQLSKAGILQTWSEWKRYEKRLGVKDGKWTVQQKETAARQFERYLKTGKAPLSADNYLAKLFAKFKAWLEGLQKDLPQLDPQAAQVFDRMLAGKQPTETGGKLKTAPKVTSPKKTLKRQVEEYRNNPKAGYVVDDAALADGVGLAEYCQEMAQDLAGQLPGSEIVELTDRKTALGKENGYRPDKSLKELNHFVVKVGDLYVDITGAQFGTQEAGVRVLTEEEIREDWGEILFDREDAATEGEEGDDATSIKNAVVDELREKRGAGPIVRKRESPLVGGGQTMDEWLDEAKRRHKADPDEMRELVGALLTTPRNVSPVEMMGLGLYYREANNRLDAETQARLSAQKSGDAGLEAQARLKEEETARLLGAIEEAASAAGAEWSRAGMARQAMLLMDYSRAALVRKGQASKGEALTREEMDQLAEMADRIAELEAQIEKMKEKATQDEVETALEDLIEENTPGKGGKRKKGGIRKGAKGAKESKDPRHPDEIEVDPKDEWSIANGAKEMFRYFVWQGMMDKFDLVHAVRGELKKKGVQHSPKETMHAITGYGIFNKASKDPLDAKVADMTGQLLQSSKLIEMAQGLPPKLTGQQRHKPSKAQRDQIKLVNEAKKKHGFDEVDQEGRLQSSLEAAEVATQNRIDDLNAEIEAEERLIKKRISLKPSDKLIALRKERDQRQKEHDAIFKNTDEARIEATEKALDRELSRLRAELMSGDVMPKSLKKPLTSPEIERIQEQILYVKSVREMLRMRFDERWEFRQQDAALRRRKVEYLRRIEEGDFAPKKRPERKMDPKLLKDLGEVEQIKAKFQDMRDAWTRANRTRVQKLRGLPADLFRTSHELLTAIDVSAPGRQGIFFILSHPLKSWFALKAMFGAARSEKSFFRSLAQLKQRGNSHLYLRDKVACTSYEGKLTKQEEAVRGHWGQMLPLVKQSQRAYVAFLNTLRADMYDHLTATLGRKGGVTAAEGRIIADFVNVATGRGGLWKLEAASGVLADYFFSPRFVSSRIQMAMGSHLLFKGNRRTKLLVLKEHVRAMAGATAFVASVMFFLGLGEDDEDKPTLELSPLSTNFGRINFKNSHIDLSGGILPAMMIVAKATRGIEKKADGSYIDLRGDKKKWGQGVQEEIVQWSRYKLSPLGSFGVNILTGETAMHEEITPLSQAKDLTVPLVWREYHEIAEEHNLPKGTALSLMATAGVSISTYDPNKSKKKKAWYEK